MGGNSGGGGGSGVVDYPDYMESVHAYWLNAVSLSIGGVSNPYLSYSAYDPDVELASMIDCMQDLIDYLDAIDSDAGITSAASTYGILLQDEIDSNIVPQFEAGMRNINAVQSSAFVIGKALLYARKVDQVAKYTSDMSVDSKLKLAELRRASLTTFSDVYRLQIVAKKEEYEQQMETSNLYQKWELDKWAAGGDMLSAIGGGHSGGGGGSRPSKIQSAIGGALTGAAVGAAAGGGNPLAIGAGAILGGLSTYL